MSVKTNNIYGKIIISNNTICRYVNHIGKDCYGIVEFAPKNIFGGISDFFRFGSKVKGVKVRANGDRMFIDVTVVVKYGVSIKAVVEALKESLKYKVERFSGMLVDTINVNVKGVKL